MDLVGIHNDCLLLGKVASEKSEGAVDHNHVLVENYIEQDANEIGLLSFVLLTLSAHVEVLVGIGDLHPVDDFFVALLLDLLVFFSGRALQHVLKVKQLGLAKLGVDHEGLVGLVELNEEASESDIVLNVHDFVQYLDDFALNLENDRVILVVLVA